MCIKSYQKHCCKIYKHIISVFVKYFMLLITQILSGLRWKPIIFYGNVQLLNLTCQLHDGNIVCMCLQDSGLALAKYVRMYNIKNSKLTKTMLIKLPILDLILLLKWRKTRSIHILNNGVQHFSVKTIMKGQNMHAFSSFR